MLQVVLQLPDSLAVPREILEEFTCDSFHYTIKNLCIEDLFNPDFIVNFVKKGTE